jgi:hypothetical protein
MSRSRTFRAPLAALAIGSLALVATACGDDDASVDVTPGAVELGSAGSESGRVELPGAAEVGQTGSSSATVAIALRIEGGGLDEEVPVTLRLDYDAEVIEADTAGYVVENEFTGAEILDGPDGADFSTLEDLVGVRYRETFNPDGTSDDTELVDEGDLTDAQREAYEQFGSQVESTTFDYPDEPVGVGATWTSVSNVQQQGFDLDVTYHYELTALEGDRYTIEISYDEDIDDTFSADGTEADVTGTLTGGGSTTGTIGNPLAVETSLEQDLDMRVEADGESLDMAMQITVAVEPRAA